MIEFDDNFLIEPLAKVAAEKCNISYEEAKKVVGEEIKKMPCSVFKDGKEYFNRPMLDFDYSYIPDRFRNEWEQFLVEEDVLPNLIWRSSTHPLGCKAHKKYWNRIWPIRDLFWKEHHPGDCEGCQCYISSTDEPATY